jgi:hypothetical protein
LLVARPASAQGRAQGYQWGFSFSFREFGGKGDRLLRSGGTTEGQQIVDALQAGLSFSALTPRLQLSFGGWAAGQRLRDRPELDRVSYSLSAFGSYRLTPRASVVFGQALGSGFDLNQLATIGTLFPQVSAISNASSVGFFYRLSPRTTTSARYTYSWIDYEAQGFFDGSDVFPGVLAAEQALSEELPEPEPIPDEPAPAPDPFEPGRLSPGIVDSSQNLLNLMANEGFSVERVRWGASDGAVDISHQLSQKTSVSAGVHYAWNDFDSDRLVDGASFGASSSISRQVGQRGSLSLSYGFSQSQSQVPVVRNHSVSGGWGMDFGRRSSISVSAGVNYFQAEGTSYAPSLQVGTGYQTRFRRGGLYLRYSRSTYLAIGFGQNRLTDQATAGFGVSLTRKLYWGTFAAYLRSRDQLKASRWFEAEAVGSQLGYQIAGQVGLGASYVYRLDHAPGLSAALENQLWSFYVSYGRNWRR